MLALNSASILSNACSLKCVLDTFNTDVTLFRILSLDGIISLMFSFFSALTHGLSALGFLQEGKVKCSLMFDMHATLHQWDPLLADDISDTVSNLSHSVGFYHKYCHF